MIPPRRHHAFGILAMLLAAALSEEEILAAGTANSDEAKVPPYVLPDPLVMQSGVAVAKAEAWPARRAELLALFAREVYGAVPPKPKGAAFHVAEEADLPGGAGRRRVVVMNLDSELNAGPMRITILQPNGAKGVPVFVGMHLFDSASPAPMTGAGLAAKLADAKAGPPPAPEIMAEFEKLPGDGLAAALLGQGYAVATLDAKDIAPDDKDRHREGIVGRWLGGAGHPGPEEWGAISAWAWGLSRALDYFEIDPAFDAKRAIVIGHSRMGKTALWAGANDERFAMVVSNNSGCGGAALSKRIFGETVGMINDRFPHWFCGNFKKYNEKEADLPVDQHQLIALIAPRPVYVGSAERDAWADPHGEFLAAKAAAPVYRLLGAGGIEGDWPVPLNHPLEWDGMGYHYRSGPHALSDYDWMAYAAFAGRKLGK